MSALFSRLCPRPRQLQLAAGQLVLEREPTLGLGSAADTPAARLLQRVVAGAGLDPGPSAPSISLALTEGPEASQAYELQIDEHGVVIRSSGAAGLFYGVCTLAQLLRLAARDGRVTLPCARIEDTPSLARRGVLLDISRDKVPTLETTLALVELFASLKLNELQLYMEHTFAYVGHERVWEGASPFTGAEIEELDRFCRARHIELIPNQNSFGHLQRWLALEPYRSELAEAPNGFPHLWNPRREAYGLCATDPRSLAFVSELYDQLLPHFTSRTVNVGLDEPFDLGLGRSRQACAARGTERVYLDYLKQVHAMVSARGFRMQFWGDAILEHPELIGELPRDAIALEWGYEHDSPFAEHLPRFAAAGLAFYVCPGTSSWNSIVGRTENALLNLASAAKQGCANGARGMLICDWGDNGHLQPLCASYVGYLAGAALAWRAEDAQAPRELPVAEWIDAFVLDGAGPGLGQLLCDFGDVYQALGSRPSNSSGLFYFIAGRRGQPIVLPHTALSDFDTTYARLQTLDGVLAGLAPRNEETRRCTAELAWASDLLKVACHIGQARFAIGLDAPISRLELRARQALAAELSPLIERHERLWGVRNRRGGIDESAGQLRRVVGDLRAEA